MGLGFGVWVWGLGLGGVALGLCCECGGGVVMREQVGSCAVGVGCVVWCLVCGFVGLVFCV